jgi:hypothetical protein
MTNPARWLSKEFQLLFRTVAGSGTQKRIKPDAGFQQPFPSEGNLPGTDFHGFGKAQAHDPVRERGLPVCHLENDDIGLGMVPVCLQNCTLIIGNEYLVIIADQTDVAGGVGNGHVPAPGKATVSGGEHPGCSGNSRIFDIVLMITLIDHEDIAGQF